MEAITPRQRRKRLRRIFVTGWLASLLLLMAAGSTAKAQGESPSSSGQRLETLVAAEQAALDANDPDQILASARQLGALGLQLLGSLYVEQNRCTLASDTYRQALSVSETSGMQQQRLQTALFLLTSELCAEHTEAADKVTSEIVASTAKTAQIHLLLAAARHASGDLPGTITELTQAVTLDPRLGPAHLALGNAYWELNEYQYNADSLREFTLACTLLPGDFVANENLGSVLSQYERYEDAAPFLEKAAGVDPSSPGPWLQLGMNAYAQNHTDEALLALGKAVTLTGTNEALNAYGIRRAYATLSRLNAEKAKTTEAEAWAGREQAVRTAMAAGSAPVPLTESTGVTTDPAHLTPPHPALGASAPATPSPEMEAVARHLKEIIAKSLNDAGTVFARNRDFGAALPLFRLAASADGDQQPVMRNLGLAAFHTGDYATAIDALTYALQQNPGDALVSNDLAQSRAMVAGQTPSSKQ